MIGNEITTFWTCATSTPSICGFLLPCPAAMSRSQIAWYVQAMTVRGSVTAGTEPSRVLRHLERFTVATGTFPHAEMQLGRQEAVFGRSGTSTGSQVRRRTPKISSERWIRTLRWLSLARPRQVCHMFRLGHIKRRLDVRAGHVAFVALLGTAGTHVSVRLLFVPATPNVFVTSESSYPGSFGS